MRNFLSVMATPLGFLLLYAHLRACVLHKMKIDEVPALDSLLIVAPIYVFVFNLVCFSYVILSTVSFLIWQSSHLGSWSWFLLFDCGHIIVWIFVFCLSISRCSGFCDCAISWS